MSNYTSIEASHLHLVNELNQLSLELNSLDKQRSQYIFLISHQKITDQYLTILRELRLYNSQNLAQIQYLETIINELKEFKKSMKVRDDYLFQRKTLQTIFNNNINSNEKNKKAQQLWQLLKNALDSSNLIILGEINRSFNQEINSAQVNQNVDTTKILLIANKSFSTAENIAKINISMENHIYILQKNSTLLINTLQKEANSFKKRRNHIPVLSSTYRNIFYLLGIISIIVTTIMVTLIFFKIWTFDRASNSSVTRLSRFDNYNSQNEQTSISSLLKAEVTNPSEYLTFLSDIVYHFFLRTNDTVIVTDTDNTPMINSNAFLDFEKNVDVYSSDNEKPMNHFNYSIDNKKFIISGNTSSDMKSSSLPIKSMHSVGKLDHKILFLESMINQGPISNENQRLDSLGRISGEVAHDINNMISVIVSCLKILRDSKNLISNDDTQVIDRALFSADKSIGIIDRLLAFACHQKLNPELIDINDLIEGLYEVICFSTEKEIQVTMNLLSEKTFIYLDPGQLEASIINLCINSINAIEDSGQVTISTSIDTNNPEQEEYLKISVHDTGHGIPKKLQTRIFEPFFTGQKKVNGQGLGLSAVYGFVKQSGGYIHVDSEPGIETTISLFFKLGNDQ